MNFLQYFYVPVLFSALVAAINAASEPFVLFPSAFFWNTTNLVYVTPLLKSRDYVDVRLSVEEEQAENVAILRRTVFTDLQSRRPTMETSIFKVKLPPDSVARRYYVTVSLAGHMEFHGYVNGASDVSKIFLQTDKSFYQPDETVSIRALPITHTGELYVGDVEFQLLDPNGFRIFNKTLYTVSGFIETEFVLPTHVRFGEWRIVAGADHSFRRAVRPIRVQEYVLPKYHVFLSIVDSGESPFIVTATVMARFANGMQLSGDVFFGCEPLSGRDDGKPLAAATVAEPLAADAPSPLRRKIGKGELLDGHWTGRLNLTECLRSELTAHYSTQHAGRSSRQPSGTSAGSTRLLVSAEVHERSTFLASLATVEFDPLAAGFELVPLRPAYTQYQRTVAVYLRPAGGAATDGEALAARTVELVAQCVSADSAANGLNRSLGDHRLGTVVEVPVDLRCTVLLIKGRTKFSDGGSTAAGHQLFYYSREERLVVPSLFRAEFLQFHLIRITNTVTADVPKVVFLDGEMLSAVVPPDRGLNYFVICNSRDVIAAAVVPIDGRINVIIEAARMGGTCVLYVYGIDSQTSFADMHLFFVADSAQCSDSYSLETSQHNASVFEEVELRLRAPFGSLAALHAYDGRLDALAAQWRRTVIAGAASPVAESPAQLWTFAEFMAPIYHSDFAFLANLLPMNRLNRHLKEICALAGRQTPQCSPRADPATASFMSDVCAREIVCVCNEHASAVPSLSGLQDRHTHPIVEIASFSDARLQRPPENLIKRPGLDDTMQSDAPADSFSLADFFAFDRTKSADTAASAQETALRYYFPEVWLFNSYVIGPTEETIIRAKTPHSVTNWKLNAQFWTRGQPTVCKASHRTLLALKHVFMDVDMPLHVYENETVQVRVTVSDDNLKEPTANLAVCFGGLSPNVCGDVGRNGTLGEIGYTRIVLRADQRVQVKKFYVRFLRAGHHNLTFELREESALPGGDWHCRDNETRLYDRISRQVRVDERVDLEEHYRQVIVYQTKRILPEQSLPLAKAEVALAGLGEHHTGVMRRASVPDIIQYSQSYRGTDDSLLTEVHINSLEKVYNMQLEFSKFEPSLPPSLTMALQRTPASGARLSPLQADVPRSQRYRDVYHDRREVAASPSYSLPTVLRILAAATYELKPLDAYRTQLANEIAWRKYIIGSLLSKLLTYSDCAGTEDETCGFGEFGRPKHPGQRSPLLSALATSLLCEQSASPEFVCGPSRYLAEIVRQLNSTNRIEVDLGFSTQLRFSTYQEKALFMQCLLVRMVLDCGMYQCVQAKKNAWQDLHRDFFTFDERHVRDVRIEAALAYVSTPSTRQLMRLRLAGRGNVDRLPFWSATTNRRPARDLLETNIMKSENILTNSLALLAYSATRQLYDYYRNKFDFDALAGWMIEQQSASGLYESAIDTYFGCRALYSYRVTQSPVGFESRKIYANLTSDSLSEQRQFSNSELPFSLSMPPITGNMALSTRGDGRLLVGVRVLSGRRRRSKRDPSDNYPVSIRMTQTRDGATNFINQTVTLLAHSAMLKYLEVEHGIFTGFTTQPSLVSIRSDSASFYYDPEVSTFAVHFVIENIRKDEPVTYSLMLTEPEDSYSPNDLAPIAISAIHHTVVGRLIVLPTSLSFMETAQSDELPDRSGGLVTLLSDAEDDSVEYSPQLRELNLTIFFDNFANDDDNDDATVLTRRRRQSTTHSRHRHRHVVALQPPQFFDTAADLTADNLQSSTDELVETVCLPNGACTCAEMTCQMQCSNCSALTFSSLCAELLRPARFSVIFRILERRIAEIGRARYTVFDVRIIDWFGEVDAPKELSIWIRDCNPQCIRLADAAAGAKPRFLLIGDWRGLFSEGANNPSPDDVGNREFSGGVSRLGMDEDSAGRQRRAAAGAPSNSGNRRRVRDSALRSHYVVRDNDRLARSTDCWPLFGRLQDEQCAGREEL